jgi:hypothetical protein
LPCLITPNEGTEIPVNDAKVSEHPTEPPTLTFDAKADGVPIKVVTASAIRAMEASLCLFELDNILISPSFLSLESFGITSNLAWDGDALMAQCLIQLIFVGLVRHFKLKYSIR